MEYSPHETKPTIVLCGYNRIGYSILNAFSKIKKNVLIIDYNPEIIDKIAKRGYHCIYGDVNDGDIIDKMELKKIKMLISTVPEVRDSLYLIRKTREVNKKAKIIVTASEIDEALRLYNAGADYVIMPHFLGGEHASRLISAVRGRKKKIHEEKEDHIKHLKERKDIGHEHPKT
jgi:Trk K+ transport system NAD-binding subunit